MNELITFTPSQMALVRRTVAKDATDTEYNLFMEMAKGRGLNPLLRHVYCFIMSKDDPKKRQMVVVVSRDGQRALAERTLSYRPDEKAPRFVIDPDLKAPKINPIGLVSAEVSVYKHSHGEWFPVTEIAYYDEYAPVKEIWRDQKPTGEFQLDPKKDGWRKMPRIMLAKCAEMAALRKAFPDSFSGLYGEEEMDRGEVLDLSPSEWAEKAEQEDRIARIGGPDTYIIDWLDGNELRMVPGGKLHDQVMAFIASCEDEPSAIRAFRERNRHSLASFWAVHKSDALSLKQAFEKAEAQTVEDTQPDLEAAIKQRETA